VIFKCKIWGSEDSDSKECGLLVCDYTGSCLDIVTFSSNLNIRILSVLTRLLLVRI
jgi:hypothetical protein